MDYPSVQLLVRPGGHRAQSCAIALRSPASERSPDLNRIHREFTLHGNRRPVERCEQPDRPVETRKRGRGRTGRSEDFCRRLDPRVDPLHREIACPWGDTGRTKLPNPRPPGAFRRRIGGGWERVHRDGRAEGSFGPPSVFASVNLVPLLWTGVPTPSTPVDRQVPLPIFRCPGNAFTLRSGLP